MIISCGEALIDFLPAGFGDELGYVPRPGGAPFNLAVALARLHIPAGFLGAIGDDPFGDLLVQTLDNNQVNQRYVVRRHRPSTLAFVTLSAFGGTDFSFFHEGAADQSLIPADLPPQLGDEVQALCFGSYSLVTEPTGSTLLTLMQRETGRRLLSLDPNVRPAFQPDRAAYRRRIEDAVALATLVKVSRRDLSWLYPDTPYEQVMVDWLRRGPRLVVVTLREQGAALARVDGLRCTDAGISVTVQDAVGAGDAFHAALLYYLRRHAALSADAIMALTEAQLREALHYANRAAAIACRRSGGANGPSLHDLAG